MLRQFGTGTIDFDQQLAEIDVHALNAEGDVKERIMTFLDEIPGKGDLFVRPEAREDYNDLAMGVARACEASGTAIDIEIFDVG